MTSVSNNASEVKGVAKGKGERGGGAYDVFNLGFSKSVCVCVVDKLT
jgi:hypothetical protein